MIHPCSECGSQEVTITVLSTHRVFIGSPKEARFQYTAETRIPERPVIQQVQCNHCTAIYPADECRP